MRFFLYEAFEDVIAPYWMANKESVVVDAFVVLMTGAANNYGWATGAARPCVAGAPAVPVAGSFAGGGGGGSRILRIARVVSDSGILGIIWFACLSI